MNTLEKYIADIQKNGLVIDTVFDIGAHKGWWSLPLKNGVLRDSFFYLFEANPAHEAELKATGFPYYLGVLSAPGRDTVEFYSIEGTGDSYYRENTKFYDNTVATTVSARTLETVIKEATLPVPQLLKLDTQGSEIDILRGAESVLSLVDLVYLECPVLKYNAGAPSLTEYIDYMKSQNFMPSDVLEVHSHDKALIQIDMMFINITTKERLYGKDHTPRYL